VQLVKTFSELERQDMTLIPDRLVAKERYRCSTRTLDRWSNDPKLKFAKPIYIRGRKYRDDKELNDFDESRKQAARGGADKAA
jgi:hypothetical protein